MARALTYFGEESIIDSGCQSINGRRVQPHHPRGGEAMRITLHIGTFTVTIIVKKRGNRHPGR